MIKKILALLGVIASVLAVAILNFTTPSVNGAAVVLLFFIVTYVALVAGFTFFIYWLSLLFGKLVRKDKKPTPDSSTFRRSYYYASVFALAPVIVISMKSVGRSGAMEWMLVAFFLILGYVYVSRQTT